MLTIKPFLDSKQSQQEHKLPLPIDPDHKFAPVALGDVVLLLAKILTSVGEQGLGDQVRGQLITLTGPIMVVGPELVEAANKALKTKLEFFSVKEAEAKKLLSGEQGEEINEAEKEYLLEYYSLVRAGMTSYCSTMGFESITGQKPQELDSFFKAHSEEFKPGARREKLKVTEKGKEIEGNGTANKSKKDGKEDQKEKKEKDEKMDEDEVEVVE